MHAFRIHAADVLRNLYVIMQRGGVLSSAFPENMELSLLASFFAAIVHDYDHRGFNNDFLVKTSDPLAVSSLSSRCMACICQFSACISLYMHKGAKRPSHIVTNLPKSSHIVTNLPKSVVMYVAVVVQRSESNGESPFGESHRSGYTRVTQIRLHQSHTDQVTPESHRSGYARVLNTYLCGGRGNSGLQ